jgi:hypothetical protein
MSDTTEGNPITKIVGTLAFFRSCILSGEAWSDACEAEYADACATMAELYSEQTHIEDVTAIASKVRDVVPRGMGFALLFDVKKDAFFPASVGYASSGSRKLVELAEIERANVTLNEKYVQVEQIAQERWRENEALKAKIKEMEQLLEANAKDVIVGMARINGTAKNQTNLGVVSDALKGRTFVMVLAKRLGIATENRLLADIAKDIDACVLKLQEGRL